MKAGLIINKKMLDLADELWYNATTSARLFYAIKQPYQRRYTICCSVLSNGVPYMPLVQRVVFCNEGGILAMCCKKKIFP